MEETKKTVICKGGILQRVKECIAKAWDPGWCSLWIFGDDDTEHTAYKRRRKRYVPTDSYNDDEYMEQTRRRRYGDNEQPRYDSRFNEGNRR